MTLDQFKTLHKKFSKNESWNMPEYERYIDALHENKTFDSHYIGQNILLARFIVAKGFTSKFDSHFVIMIFKNIS